MQSSTSLAGKKVERPRVAGSVSVFHRASRIWGCSAGAVAIAAPRTARAKGEGGSRSSLYSSLCGWGKKKDNIIIKVKGERYSIEIKLKKELIGDVTTLTHTRRTLPIAKKNKKKTKKSTAVKKSLAFCFFFFFSGASDSPNSSVNVSTFDKTDWSQKGNQSWGATSGSYAASDVDIGAENRIAEVNGSLRYLSGGGLHGYII